MQRWTVFIENMRSSSSSSNTLCTTRSPVVVHLSPIHLRVKHNPPSLNTTVIFISLLQFRLSAVLQGFLFPLHIHSRNTTHGILIIRSRTISISRSLLQQSTDYVHYSYSFVILSFLYYTQLLHTRQSSLHSNSVPFSCPLLPNISNPYDISDLTPLTFYKTHLSILLQASSCHTKHRHVTFLSSTLSVHALCYFSRLCQKFFRTRYRVPIGIRIYDQPHTLHHHHSSSLLHALVPYVNFLRITFES